MGQLDEAIRAHLELKRKHGASEEELKAEEQEALGPVRREPPPVEPASELDADAADAFDEPPAADSLEETPLDALDEEGAPAAFDEPPLHVPHAYDEPLEEVAPEAFHGPVDPLVEPGFEDRAEAEPETVEYAEGFEPLDPEGFEPLDPETGEPVDLAAAEPVDAEAAEPLDPDAPLRPAPPAPAAGDTPPRGVDPVDPAAAEEEEDVLEETPDFLQETPEHDRLWFEQKPPRDFDFDE